MKALITGIGGFAGAHLARHLLQTGYSVCGTTHRAAAAESLETIETFRCDVRDLQNVESVIGQARPDVIFHLAAITSERAFNEDPPGAYMTNVMGTENLLSAVSRLAPQARVLIVGSSAEYGLVNADENPIAETAPLRPVMGYGVTKLAQSFVALRFFLSRRMPVVRVRSFNYAGPGQGESFVIATLCKQVAMIEKKLQPPVLSLWNLEARRDFSDVRDVVRAYEMAARLGKPGDLYNISSGAAHRIGDLLDRLLAMANIKPKIESTSDHPRSDDVPIQIGDSRKLRELTGWEPKIPIDVTLRDTLDFWRQRISRQH